MISPRLAPDALSDLLAKYTEMVRLREAHAAPNELDPREHLARLAARFPGALRELDELPMELLRDRLAAVERACARPASAAPWMVAVHRFHVLARGALAAKRWLAGRKRVDARVCDAFLADCDELPFPDDARAWAGALDAIASPPGGRVTPLVFARLATELGVAPREARDLVFPSRRRG